jgi:hypothetical protein
MSIFSTLETYFSASMNPFRIHEYFKYGIPLSGKEEIKLNRVYLTESVLISWGFFIINCFYIMVTYLISHDSILSAQEELREVISTPDNLGIIVLITFLILKSLFFPIFCFIHIGFWKVVLYIFAELLEIKEDDREEIIDDIISISYSSHVFLAIPFFGSLVQYIDELMLMYSGIKVRMGATRSLTLLIVSFPYFLFIALWAIVMLLITYLLV